MTDRHVTIKQAYDILGLIDPEEFKKQIIVSRMKNTEYLKTRIPYRRRIGKTTKLIVDASINVLSGNDVVFVTSNHKARIYAEEILEKTIWDLNTKIGTKYEDIGKYNVVIFDWYKVVLKDTKDRVYMDLT